MFVTLAGAAEIAAREWHIWNTGAKEWKTKSVPRWTFETTSESAEFIELIRQAMIASFGISDAEATGRINRFWQGQEFRSELKVSVLLHEDEDHWARRIYFGHDSYFWLKDEASLTPVPWP